MEWICRKENPARIQSIFAFITRTDEKELVIELNPTHRKVPVRLCSITGANRTPVERLDVIDFWFCSVRLAIPGSLFHVLLNV